jgi:hypothetical protein
VDETFTVSALVKQHKGKEARKCYKQGSWLAHRTQHGWHTIVFVQQYSRDVKKRLRRGFVAGA